MVGVVMGEQDVLNLLRLAPRLARRLQDDLPVFRQAGIDYSYLFLRDHVGAHVPHPDPVDIRQNALDSHTQALPSSQRSRRRVLVRCLDNTAFIPWKVACERRKCRGCNASAGGLGGVPPGNTCRGRAGWEERPLDPGNEEDTLPRGHRGVVGFPGARPTDIDVSFAFHALTIIRSTALEAAPPARQSAHRAQPRSPH